MKNKKARKNLTKIILPSISVIILLLIIAIPVTSASTLVRNFSLPTPFFSPNSAYNQNATQIKVLPLSGNQILNTYRVLRGDTTNLAPGIGGVNYPFMFINYDNWTVPIFRMGNNNNKVRIRNYNGDLGMTNPKIPMYQIGGLVNVPAAAGNVRPSGPVGTDSDGHLILYNPSTRMEYDYWDATTILANGGHMPDNWNFIESNGNVPVWDTVAHSGTRSVKIKVNGTKDDISGYPNSDFIKASPLTDYQFSAWGKTTGAGGTNAPAVRAVEFDSNGNEIQQQNLVFNMGTNNWMQEKMAFKTSANTRYLNVYASIWEGYGTFWLDDVYLSLSTSTTNLVINPSFEKATHSLGGGYIGPSILDAGNIDFFNTTKSGTNPDTYYSARATGVPLLAGLILPEDIKQKVIRHALAFGLPALHNTAPDPQNPIKRIDYFYPTSTTEVHSINKNKYSLAAGQRIRLRTKIVNEYGNTINENKLTPITRIYLTSLRSYGAYLVEAAAWTFYAEDIHTAKFDVTNDQVNWLIGKPSGSPLPNEPKWQIVMEKLNDELSHIPIAYGPWKDGQNPATATINYSNFDVIEPANII